VSEREREKENLFGVEGLGIPRKNPLRGRNTYSSSSDVVGCAESIICRTISYTLLPHYYTTGGTLKSKT